MNNHQEIKRLLEKHLARQLSPDERQELFDKLRNIHSPEELDIYFRKYWQLKINSEVITDLSWTQILNERNRRIILARKRNRNVIINQMWQWGVAASVLLLISLIYWNWDSEPAYVTYSTDFGETKNIILDDGTSVILNANSELTWSNEWKDDKTRFAQLRGEAFFKVSHLDRITGGVTKGSDLNKRIPFQVMTSDVVIDVLGTTFNVAERRGETQVFLEKGSVQLGFLDKSFPDNIQNPGIEKSKPVPQNPLIMKPGETIQYSAETKKLQKSKSDQPESLTEWKDGSLVYHDVLFGDMLDHMEDIYGKEFKVQDKELLELNVSFGVPYKNWKIVGKLMERSLGVEIIPGSNNKTIIKKRIE